MGGRCWCSRPNPTSVHIIYVRTPELNQVFTVEGAILAAENREGMNSKRGRREEEGSEEVPITCHGHKTLPSHAAKILRQLLTFVKVRIARFCVDASGRTADSLVVGTWKT